MAELVEGASAWVRRWTGLAVDLTQAGKPAPRTMLDVACGHGRHMHWFAAQGFATTGVDWQPDSLAVAQPAGEVIEADIENGPWPLSGRRFGLVVVTNYLWRPLLPTIVESVAEGGLLVYETFAAGNETVGRPARADFLLQPGELLAACRDLRVVAYEDGFEPDSPARMARFVQRIAAVRLAGDAPARLQISPFAH